MAYRVVEIEFRPDSAQQWRIHGSVRQESARLWTRLIRLHAYIRRRQWKWPSYNDLARWSKGKFPALHSGSVQQICKEFIEAVDSTRQKRLNGDAEAKYPWKTKQRYRGVAFTNQAPRIRGRRMLLPCGRIEGKRAYLSVTLPKKFLPPGKLSEIRLEFSKLSLVYKVGDEAESEAPEVVAIDPGVNTLLAATDGVRVVQVSGRAVKSMIQYRNKALAEIVQRQSFHKKGSKRWKRLQRAKRNMLACQRRKVRDTAHKATRAIANAFPGHRVIMGKPFNDAARKLRRTNAQTVSQAVNGMIARYLDYKMAGCEQDDEYYTSQTCPVCGERRKCGRIYSCKSCGLRAPRDAVGCVNIRTKGMTGEIQNIPPEQFPTNIKYLRVRIKTHTRSRSGGHPGTSSAPQPLHQAV